MIRLDIKVIENMAKQRPSGYFEDILNNSSNIIRDSDNNILYIELTNEKYECLKTKYRSNYNTSFIGVGSQLKLILSKFGIKSSPTCPCNEYATIMDTKGIEWCESNIDTIIGWLETEARKRHIPFVKYAAKLIVKRAINNAKKLKKSIEKINKKNE